MLGVVQSAFGYQGQKCSACSRVIVLAAVYDTFLDRLVEATRSLQVGPAEDPATSVGPVIDAEACRAGKQVHRRSDVAKGARVLAVDVGRLPRRVFTSARTSLPMCRPESRLAQEEIFGPVLAVMRAADLDEALRDRQRHRLRPDRRDFFPQPGPSAIGPGASCWSATCISIAASPGPWWRGSRSAVSRCRASAARPAGPIICCNSSCRARSPKTRCAAASRRRLPRKANVSSLSARAGVVPLGRVAREGAAQDFDAIGICPAAASALTFCLAPSTATISTSSVMVSPT